jgi:glutathione S-transferase
MYPHAAFVTLLAVLVLGFAGALVGRARGRFGIHAPATSGHPDFERVFRAQMNTLEQTVAFLPTLWLAALFFDPMYAAWAGYAWVAARVWYVLAYARDAKARGPAFLVGSLALLAVLAMALWGVGKALLAG